MTRNLAVCTVLLAIATPLYGQAADSGAFVVRLGNDTLVLERFVHTGTRMQAEALIRSPATIVRRYDLRMNSQGGIQRLETTDIALPQQTVTRRETLLVVGDSAVQLVSAGDSTRENRFAMTRRALPFLNLVQWPNELILSMLGPNVGDSAVISYLTGSNVSPFVLRRVARDSVTLRHPSRGTSRLHVDAHGRLLHLDASTTTLKLDVERKHWLPLGTLIPVFAARDSNRPRRELSPRGETRATVDGANIVVDYGRPQKRGRTIFGNVVPYGQVWRTGANTATQFKTDRDLVIAGRILPAGNYSIFSIPQAREWTIIINAQTDQSGTAHDPARDVMRVPARVYALRDVVEQFTIAVSDEPSGGTLRLQWDRSEAVLPFEVTN